MIKDNQKGKSFKLRKYEELKPYFDEFEGTSDRACAIIGEALLDKILKDILKNAFVPVPENKDQLNSISFIDKINLTYRLGIIKCDVRNALSKIHGIRNIFAHELTINDFENNKIKKRILDLKKYPYTKKLIKKHKQHDWENKRNVFESIIVSLCGYLVASKVSPIKLEIDPEIREEFERKIK